MIEIENVSKVYKMGDSEVHALRDVQLHVPAGAFVAIVGPSGSGKSTLMNIIGCLDTPSSGSYRLDGQLVSNMRDDALATVRNRKIGFVFQTFNLLPRQTALENVSLPLLYAGVSRRERREQSLAALKRVELTDRALHKPAELSGGQRQRVAIARALVTQPLIVLADEPTANLDSDTGHKIVELMRTINETDKTTFIFSTHDHHIMEHARKVVNIRDGHVTGVEARS